MNIASHGIKQSLQRIEKISDAKCVLDLIVGHINKYEFSSM